MRRKDKEVTDKQDLLEIVRNCKVCRLGLAVDERPYVVPLNFGYSWEEAEPLKLFFHCASVGLKLDMLAKNNLLCFEMDYGHKLLPAPTASKYSFAYASIIGWGRGYIITQDEEKRHALYKLMEHQAGPGEYEISAADVDEVTVFCLEAEEITGKKNRI